MNYRNVRRNTAWSFAVMQVVTATALLLTAPAGILAQGRGGGQAGGRGGPPPTARAAAPFDITGAWVSLITDDWEYRMVTPAKGQIQFVPLNRTATDMANAWDPAKDEAAGNQCKGYGAAAVMRLPQRARISWQDDNTLKIELDNGTQTRLFHFAAGPAAGGATTQAPKGEAASWQGYSVAQWEGAGGGRGGGGGAVAPARGGPPRGALKVVTTNMKAGYLRKNGVPYSENAVLTEWFNILEDRGVQYIAIQTQVDDPAYLTAPFFRTMQYKKEADASKFNPVPCSAK